MFNKVALYRIALLSAFAALGHGQLRAQAIDAPITFQVDSLPVKSGLPTLTAQQQAARSKLTPQQIAQYDTFAQSTRTKLAAAIAAHQNSQAVPLDWKSLIHGGTQEATAKVATTVSVSSKPFHFSSKQSSMSTAAAAVATSNAIGGPICPVWGCNGPHPINPIPINPVPVSNPDLDQDGLPDSLESSVADSFTPLYGVSAGEQQQFATFGDYVPMTVATLQGTVPPFSYYRVQPLGLATDPNGNQVYALRIDYLNLWNADGGLVGGGAACALSFVGLDTVIQQATGHDLDAERTVMLVAAPAVNGGYNPDPNAYSLYTAYLAAHEGTFFDQSQYASFAPAVPPGNHLNVALSLSKHSTYPNNPNFQTIVPAWFIAQYNFDWTALWLAGLIDDGYYALAIGLGNDTFYGCLVERFGDQGGSYASQRVNVGEPAHPINGSTFIQDNSSRALNLTDKLNNPVF